jgi:hypothetical protein
MVPSWPGTTTPVELHVTVTSPVVDTLKVLYVGHEVWPLGMLSCKLPAIAVPLEAIAAPMAAATARILLNRII